MLSFILKLKSKLDKAKYKQAKKKQEEDEKKAKEQEAAKTHEQEDDGKTDKKRDSKGEPKGKVASFITNMAANATAAFEAIPITSVLFQIIAIGIAIAIVAVIIFSALSMISGTVIDAAVEGSAALAFTNAFDKLFLTTGTDENGEYRMYFRKEVPIDPDDPESEVKTEYLSDVDLWCNITDEQIIKYVIEAKYSKLDIDLQVRYMNLFRAIRLCYRVCYLTNADGERYFKGMKPAMLIGMMASEKGLNWMSMYSCRGSGIKCEEPIPGTDETVDGTWYTYILGEWCASKPTPEQFDITKHCNIDNMVACVFMHNDVNWKDGPLSWTIGIKEGLDKLDEPRYEGLKDAIFKYPEYAPLKDITGDDWGFSSGNEDYVTGSLIYSVLATAGQYSHDWWDGTYSKTTKTPSSNLFLERYADIDIGLAIGRGSDAAYGANITCDSLLKLSGITDDIEDEYYKFAYGMARCVYGDAMTDAQYQDWMGELAAMMYYTYHHMPCFTEAIYQDAIVVEPKDGSSEPVDQFVYEVGYTEDDYYTSLSALYQGFLTLMQGHTMNGVLPNLAFSESEVSDDGEETGTAWTPGVVSIDVIKKSVSGWWMIREKSINKAYTISGSEGADYFPGYLGMDEEILKKAKYESKVSFMQLDTGTDKISLDNSLWYYLDTQSNILKTWGISGIEVCELWKPIAFADNFSDSLSNLHALHAEGVCAMLGGANTIRALTEALYAWLPSVTDQPINPPVIENLKGTPVVTLGRSLMLDDYDSKKDCPVFKKDDSGKYLVQNTVFPLSDYSSETAGVQNCFGNSYYIHHGFGYYADDFSLHCGADLPENSYGFTSVAYLFTQAYAEKCINGNNREILSLTDVPTSTTVDGVEYDLTQRQEVVAIADGVISSFQYGNFQSYMGVDNACGNNWFIYHYLMGNDEKVYRVKFNYLHLCPDNASIFAARYNCTLPSLNLDGGTYSHQLGSSTLINGKPFKSAEMLVKEGDLLGYMGSTGKSTGTHLHFGISSYDVWNTIEDCESGSKPVKTITPNTSDLYNSPLTSMFMGYDRNDLVYKSLYPLYTGWISMAFQGSIYFDYDIASLEEIKGKLKGG